MVKNTGKIIEAIIKAKKALDMEVENIILGIGGSSTYDGGVGMATALGVKFYDQEGKEVKACGGELIKIRKIDTSCVDKRIEKTKFIIACDVNNPLTGEKGASFVFGKQKGATYDMIHKLDKNLKHLANLIKETMDIDVDNIPGAGAAGGLGAGSMAFLNGELKKGIEIVIEFTKLDEKLKDVDLVITGEGQMDFQTQYGKTPVGVAEIAKKYNKKVIGLTGSIGDGYEKVYYKGIDSVFSITNRVCSLDRALLNGKENLEDVAKNIARLVKIYDSK